MGANHILLHFGISISFVLFKVRSIYWGKIAQGPILILPIWDNT